jgi:Protein of unknown function (DUF3102)
MTKKDETTTKLEQLASEIQIGHRQCMDALKSVIPQAKIIGERLIEAKKLVRRGRWQAWIDQHCKFALRMAQNYMLVAIHYTKIAALFDTSEEASLTEFVRLARNLEAEERGRRPKAQPETTFALGADGYKKKQREVEHLRHAGKLTVEGSEQVTAFLTAKLGAFFKVVRRFASSKPLLKAAGEGLDAGHLGIMLIENLKAKLNAAGLFLDKPRSPESNKEGAGGKPVNRIKDHLNGKSRKTAKV